ncbi:AMP-binding protein [Nocardia sp. NPDC049149]|uniref:AMP-binding protein n=1 Tax=Nocardia sp. NPDC049149 TaxID=3364315 RepID=UPI003718D4B8
MIVLDLATELEAAAHAATTTLTSGLIEALRRFPNSTVSDDDSTLSFAAVYEAALRRSAVLRGRFAVGDPVVLRSRNTIGFLIDLLGYLLAGLRPILTVGTGVSSAQLRHMRERATPDCDFDWSAVALYLASAGSSGGPKLTPRTHTDYALNIWLAARNAELTPYDCYLVSIPAAQNYALACPGILGALLSGSRVALTWATDYEGISAAIARHRATVLPVLATQARPWYAAAAQADSPVRLVQVCGRGVTAADVHALGGLFGATVQHSFGTDAGLLCQSAPSDDLARRAAGIGRLLSERDEFRIVDPDAAGHGWLEVRGPCTVTTYLAAPNVDTTTFTKDGWLRTGDLARAVDERHFVVHAPE